MGKRKKTLLKIFLIPILGIVLIQGIVPFLTLVFSGIKSNLEENNIRVVNHIVENRQVVLENDMVEKWRSVYQESEELNNNLSQILAANDTGVQDFLESKQVQEQYLEKVFPEMIDALQYGMTSGIFLILANDSPVGKEADYRGFFVRDSDPQTRTDSNADLLLERGNKKLSHNMEISLDSAWSTDFHFMGDGQRDADKFFYEPYTQAVQNTKANMRDLGYWAKTFILEDHYMDNHQMITYSVPLLYDGTVYGVVGVEISLNYLSNYFSVRDLDNDLNAGYALMVQNTDGKYESIVGKGSLYDIVYRDDHALEFTADSGDELCKIKGTQLGKQDIYVVTKPLSLYSNHVPYDDTDWVLCGFVTEDSIYGIGRSVYIKMITAIISGALFAVVLVYCLIRYVTKPVYRLMESVRGGVAGIHNFKNSDILEIDELHGVIETLTDEQMQTETQLLEEKERYRIAVESSQDIFFTYRKKEKILEVVNSDHFDGVWDCVEHLEWIDNGYIYPEDRERVVNHVLHAKNVLNIDFRTRYRDGEDYIWVNLSGSVMQAETGESERVVGCIHNIQKSKILEEEQKKKQLLDPVTLFYRLEYSLEAIETAREKNPKGSAALVDIRQFIRVNEQYGLIFGDVLLEELAGELVTECNNRKFENVVYVRAGADQMLLWIPGVDVYTVKDMLENVRQKFMALTDEKLLALNIKCGITQVEEKDAEAVCRQQAKTALAAAKYSHHDTVIYQELTEQEKKIQADAAFREIASVGRLKQMSLSSIAINLCDREGELAVILDILALKLREKYGLANLIIAGFNREYLVNSLLYHWKDTENFQNWDGFCHCSGSEYQQFIENKKVQEIMPVTEETLADPTLGRFADRPDGVLYHMADNGSYAGSILFMGIDKKMLDNEEERKDLDEIGSIIQNKINLQRHDLAAKAKSDFLARMSHEIRTPMNGIIGMTEIALRDGQEEERRIDCLNKIKNSSNYLLGLLNDILDMSKIESGKMKLVSERANLAKMIQGLEPLLESKVAEKQIHFSKDIDLKHSWFVCDELRINQVLVNLLGNAVKYSNAGGHVKLTVHEKSKTLELSELYFEVSDDGIGIAEDKQHLIFQSFEQADTSENARKQGTGLGLAISSRLVHMMDSQIQLKSALGKGSIFYFTLQLKPVEKDLLHEKTPDLSMDFTGKRVLVVEDNALNMEIARTLLETFDIEVEEAYNGKEAVEKVRVTPPGYYDLILMDIMMPKMDGLEATRTIRQLDREDCKTLPIIAMSANAFDEDVKRSIASGMNGHLSKPVNVSLLKETLASILG